MHAVTVCFSCLGPIVGRPLMTFLISISRKLLLFTYSYPALVSSTSNELSAVVFLVDYYISRAVLFVELNSIVSESTNVQSEGNSTPSLFAQSKCRSHHYVERKRLSPSVPERAEECLRCGRSEHRSMSERFEEPSDRCHHSRDPTLSRYEHGQKAHPMGESVHRWNGTCRPRRQRSCPEYYPSRWVFHHRVFDQCQSDYVADRRQSLLSESSVQQWNFEKVFQGTILSSRWILQVLQHLGSNHQWQSQPSESDGHLVDETGTHPTLDEHVRWPQWFDGLLCTRNTHHSSRSTRRCSSRWNQHAHAHLQERAHVPVEQLQCNKLDLFQEILHGVPLEVTGVPYPSKQEFGHDGRHV